MFSVAKAKRQQQCVLTVRKRSETKRQHNKASVGTEITPCSEKVLTCKMPDTKPNEGLCVWHFINQIPFAIINIDLKRLRSPRQSILL